MVQNVTNQFLHNMQVGQQQTNPLMFNSNQNSLNTQNFLQFQNQLNQLNQLNPAAQQFQNQLHQQQQQQQQMMNYNQNQMPNMMNMQMGVGNNNPAMMFSQGGMNQMGGMALNNINNMQQPVQNLIPNKNVQKTTSNVPTPDPKLTRHLHADLKKSLMSDPLFKSLMSNDQMKAMSPNIKKNIKRLKIAIALQEQKIKEERKRKIMMKIK